MCGVLLTSGIMTQVIFYVLRESLKTYPTVFVCHYVGNKFVSSGHKLWVISDEY